MVVVLNQVSRDKSLKLPKQLEIEIKKLQTVDEALNYSAEELYDMLFKDKEQKNKGN